MATLKSELGHAISSKTPLSQILGHILKAVNNIAVDRVKHRALVGAVNIEIFTAIECIIITTQQHFHYRCHSKSYPCLRIEISKFHVGVTTEATFPSVDVATHLIVPAIHCGQAGVVTVVTNGHYVTLCLLQRQVANDVEVVGASQHVALVHIGHQCHGSALDVDHIDGDECGRGTGHWSHPNVPKVVTTNARVAQKHAIGLAIESEVEVAHGVSCQDIKTVDNTLHDGIVTTTGIGDDQLFLLTARHIHNAAGHGGCAGIGVGDGRSEIGLIGMHPVKHPQVFNVDAIHAGILLPVGHRPATQGSDHGSHG